MYCVTHVHQGHFTYELEFTNSRWEVPSTRQLTWWLPMLSLLKQLQASAALIRIRHSNHIEPYSDKWLIYSTYSQKAPYSIPWSCTWGTICKCQNGTPKDWGVWNPVCCHSNKTVKLKLWNTFSRILLQRIKHSNCLRCLFSSYLIKMWLSVWCHHLANLHILKAWISLGQKEIFENSKKAFFFSCRLLAYALK